MARFVIECPRCGKYAEAKTGFFAKKRIECSCGYNIDVRTDKLSNRKCPHCGNDVVFDQSKGADAKCPVCHEPINTLAEQDKTVTFTCAQCGIELHTAKGAAQYVCPVCDCVNDVAEQVEKERLKNEIAVIRYEGDNNTFVWKHPIEDFKLGTKLIVHPSQEAIVVKDGQDLDLFGPGPHYLETQALPMLDGVYKLPYDKQTPFHAEIYFFNKTVQMALKWGTPDKARFIDPLTGVPLELGASGGLNLMIADSRKLFKKLVGTMKGIAWDDANGFTQSLQASFRPMITTAVKTNLGAVIKNNGIDLLEIDEKLELIADKLKEKINEGFGEYGLTVPEFYVTHVVLPEDDPNFRRIRELHTVELQKRELERESEIKTKAAQEKAKYRTAEEQSAAEIEAARREAEMQRQTTETEVARREAERKVIAAQAEAQAARMQGLTEAEVMAAKGYNQKDVLQAEVQKAYAEGIGNMGPDVVNGGGGGSNIVGDMLGLGVGMAAAGTIMPQIGNLFGNMQPQGANQPAAPANGWECACGTKGITTNFCPNCGKAKPAPADSWTCPNCRKSGITFNFCPDCGTKKPEPEQTWDCPDCGMKNISFNFCPNCGKKKPEAPKGWDCPDCGMKNITFNFCPNCGKKKPEAPATWDCPDCGMKNITFNFCPNCGKKKGE